MNPAQQEALNTYNALSGYYSAVANYATAQSTTLPYFPDIQNQFQFSNTLSDLGQALGIQMNYAVGSRVNYVTTVQCLQREAGMRALTKGQYSDQQSYVGVNDSNYWSYKAYSDIYQFTGNTQIG